jgi:drug/metabolite transporter (DMT)-like permease
MKQIMMFFKRHFTGKRETLYLRGLALSALGVVILSPDGLLLRMASEAGAWEIVFYRSLFMGLGMGAILALKCKGANNREQTAWRWRDITPVVWLVAVLIASSNVGFVGAIVHTSVADTLIIMATLPLFSAVLGLALIGEAVRPRTWVAISVSFIGVVVIFFRGAGNGDGAWQGDLMALFSAFSMGLALVVLRKWEHKDITPILCLAGFIAALAVLPWARPAAIDGRSLAILAFLGFILLPLALTLFFAGIKHVPAAEIALLALLETVLGPLWAWAGGEETLHSVSLIGGAIVVLAIAANAVLAIRK